MMSRSSSRRILLGVVFTMLLFPLGLIPVIAADTLLGDAEFLRQLLYVSKRGAAATIAGDWLSSLPFAAVCWLVLRGLSMGFGATTAMRVGLAVALLGVGLAWLPPYVPMIFGAMLFAAAVLSFVFDRQLVNR